MHDQDICLFKIPAVPAADCPEIHSDSDTAGALRHLAYTLSNTWGAWPVALPVVETELHSQSVN